MLALLFRGVCILGVVGWYSASLWTMIDGYFKDQFQRYLDEEYRLNPKMQADVREHAPPPIDTTEDPVTRAAAETPMMLERPSSCGLEEVCTIVPRPVDEADSKEEEEEEGKSVPAGADVAAENEVGPESRREVDADGPPGDDDDGDDGGKREEEEVEPLIAEYELFLLLLFQAVEFARGAS